MIRIIVEFFFLSYYIFIFFREKEDSSLFSSSKNNMYFSNIKNKKFELLFIHEVTKKNIYADKSSLTLQKKNNTIPYAKIDKNTGKNLTFFEIFWKI